MFRREFLWEFRVKKLLLRKTHLKANVCLALLGIQLTKLPNINRRKQSCEKLYKQSTEKPRKYQNLCTDCARHSTLGLRPVWLWVTIYTSSSKLYFINLVTKCATFIVFVQKDAIWISVIYTLFCKITMSHSDCGSVPVYLVPKKAFTVRLHKLLLLLERRRKNYHFKVNVLVWYKCGVFITHMCVRKVNIEPSVFLLKN